MDTARLKAVQRWIAARTRIEDDHGPLERIAGADVAYLGDRGVGATVVMDPDMKPLEEVTVEANVRFPYVPTYLSYREMGPVIKAARRVDLDILLLDGQGIAHPRSAGLATHVGVVMDVPTIGVAKSLLCGVVEGEPEVGSPSSLVLDGRTVGYAVRTKENTRPIYVSPGHRVSVEGALDITLKCVRKHKLPEPARLAHKLADKGKKELLKND